MEWVNNVITVQALPQDRHISWPTHPFSPSATQPLLHPVFCTPPSASPSPPPRHPHPHPHPPLATGHYVLVLPRVHQALSGIHSRRGLSRYPPSLPSRSFPSMHARRAYMHVRTCHVQNAGRRLTASCATHRRNISPYRGNARARKNDSPAPVPRIVFFPRCSFCFLPISVFLPTLRRVVFFFFFSRETSLLLPPFPQRTRQR